MCEETPPLPATSDNKAKRQMLSTRRSVEPAHLQDRDPLDTKHWRCHLRATVRGVNRKRWEGGANGRADRARHGAYFLRHARHLRAVRRHRRTDGPDRRCTAARKAARDHMAGDGAGGNCRGDGAWRGRAQAPISRLASGAGILRGTAACASWGCCCPRLQWTWTTATWTDAACARTRAAGG